MKDLKHKMTLRLNDELLTYVNEMADTYSISPSDFIRQCIASHKDARKAAAAFMEKLTTDGVDKLVEGLGNGIDRKTDINNHVQ